MTPLHEVIINKKTQINPIWIMRQAGRYLPEFREIRKLNPNFIKLCLNENLSVCFCESGFATKGMNAWDWAIQTIPEIQKHTDRKIVIRPHKMFIKSNDNQKINEVNKRFKNVEIRPYENESIFDVLKNTWATVIFSTTAGLPSLIEGVPLFVTSKTSMLYEMSSGDLSQIENPKLQDRLPFLIKNANRHWTQKEILEGTYWNTIRDYL